MPTQDETTEFRIALEHADLDGVTSLLKGDPRLANKMLHTGSRVQVWPLQRVLGDREGFSGDDRLEMIRTLIAAGADIDGVANPPNNEGGTALHYAAWLNAADAVDLLLEHGADTEVRNDHGERAIDNAARHGNAESVEIMIDRGAPFEIVHLVQTGLVQRLKLALETDPAAVHQSLVGGSSLLHEAVCEEGRFSLEVVELLIDSGADLNARDSRNRTPIHLALEAWKPMAADLLRSRGAEEDFLSVVASDESTAVFWQHHRPQVGLEVQPDGVTALHYAARFGRPNLVEKLLDAGVPANSRSDRWWMETTPLHSCAMHDSVECCQVLLLAGADVNARNEHGGTPLLLATRWGREEIMALLLACGADPNIRDNWGSIPADWRR